MTRTKSPAQCRRDFLKAAGVSAAFLPLLSLGRMSKAQAAAATPKRLAIVAWDNGFYMKDLWPTGTETSFTLGQTLAPFAPLQNDLLFVGGVGFKVQLDADWKALGYVSPYTANHHGFPAMLTGVPLASYENETGNHRNIAGGASIDQYIAGELAKTVTTKFPSLSLGCYTLSGDFGNSSSWAGQTGGALKQLATPITHEADPFRLFDRMFVGGNLPQQQIDKLRKERGSVLDFLARDLEAFRKRLGKDDANAVQKHLDAVRDSETQLNHLASGQCAPPTMPTKFTAARNWEGNNVDINNYPKLTKLQMDLTVAAFKCDLTRVVNILLTEMGANLLTFPWLGDEFLGPGGEPGRKVKEYHDITHSQGNNADCTRRKILADQWLVSQVAYLAQQLKDTPEGDGTMLSSSAVVMTNSSGYMHSSETVPFVIVGSCGGYFKTGRFLKVGNAMKDGLPQGRGAAHNGVLVGLANAMGVDGSKFGLPEFATELPGLRG